jgi:hypothetical protein
MLILFDHGTPAPLRAFLKDHIVKKTKDLGWDTLSNGELLRAAEEAAFEVFLTTDKNIRYQQNLADRVIAIVVLGNSRWPVVRLYIDRVVAAMTASCRTNDLNPDKGEVGGSSPPRPTIQTYVSGRSQ